MADGEQGLFPLVNAEFLIVLAPLLWTLAGVKLAVRGYLTVNWVLHPWLLLMAIGIGMAKSLVVLDRLAKKNVQRLNGYSGRVFIGRVFPARTWILIGAMILFGRLLRHLSLAPEVRGVIIVAVAVALLTASRFYWYRLSGKTIARRSETK